MRASKIELADSKVRLRIIIQMLIPPRDGRRSRYRELPKSAIPVLIEAESERELLAARDRIKHQIRSAIESESEEE